MSTGKVKAGIFDSPHVRQLIKDPIIVCSINVNEKTGHHLLQLLKKILEKSKDENYVVLVNEMFSRLKFFGCNMSINVYYIHI